MPEKKPKARYIMVRKLPDELHLRLKHRAVDEKKSLNKLIIEILESSQPSK